MRILTRTSRLASWARRFGSFALPLAVIPILLHRNQTINSDTFLAIETLAIIVAAFALLFGLAAYIRLWFTGDMGWGRATSGVIMGGICLTPLIGIAYFSQMYPVTADVATNGGQSLEMVRFEGGQRIEALAQDEVVRVFPNAVAREYPVRVNDLFRLVAAEVTNRGWEVLRREPPLLDLVEGQINALEFTWLGFSDEIAVRVVANGESTQLVMRSGSLFGIHDLGKNGRRIESFMLAMDEAVTNILRNAPLTNVAPVPAVPSR